MYSTMDGSANNYGRIGTKCLAEPSNQFGQQFGQTSRFGHRNLAESSGNPISRWYVKTTHAMKFKYYLSISLFAHNHKIQL